MATTDPENLMELTVCQSRSELMGVRSMLEAEGIAVVVTGEHHAGTKTMLSAPDPLRVMVAASDLDDARELLEEIDYAEHLPPDPELAKRHTDRSIAHWQARSEESQGDVEATPDRAGGLLGERRRAPLCLFIAAVFLLILGIQVLFSADRGGASAASISPVFLGFVSLTVLFAALGVWSYRAPLAAASIGAAVYGLVVILIASVSLELLVAGLIAHIPVGLLLWRAVVSGRRLRDQAAAVESGR